MQTHPVILDSGQLQLNPRFDLAQAISAKHQQIDADWQEKLISLCDERGLKKDKEAQLSALRNKIEYQVSEGRQTDLQDSLQHLYLILQSDIAENKKNQIAFRLLQATAEDINEFQEQVQLMILSFCVPLNLSEMSCFIKMSQTFACIHQSNRKINTSPFYSQMETLLEQDYILEVLSIIKAQSSEVQNAVNEKTHWSLIPSLIKSELNRFIFDTTNPGFINQYLACLTLPPIAINNINQFTLEVNILQQLVDMHLISENNLLEAIEIDGDTLPIIYVKLTKINDENEKLTLLTQRNDINYTAVHYIFQHQHQAIPLFMQEIAKLSSDNQKTIFNLINGMPLQFSKFMEYDILAILLDIGVVTFSLSNHHNISQPETLVLAVLAMKNKEKQTQIFQMGNAKNGNLLLLAVDNGLSQAQLLFEEIKTQIPHSIAAILTKKNSKSNNVLSAAIHNLPSILPALFNEIQKLDEHIQNGIFNPLRQINVNKLIHVLGEANVLAAYLDIVIPQDKMNLTMYQGAILRLGEQRIANVLYNMKNNKAIEAIKGILPEQTKPNNIGKDNAKSFSFEDAKETLYSKIPNKLKKSNKVEQATHYQNNL